MVSDDNDTKSQHNKGVEVSPLDIALLMLKYKWLIVVITVAAAVFPIIFDIKLINLPSSNTPQLQPAIILQNARYWLKMKLLSCSLTFCK
jgi:hypothetical protein